MTGGPAGLPVLVCDHSLDLLNPTRLLFWKPLSEPDVIDLFYFSCGCQFRRAFSISICHVSLSHERLWNIISLYIYVFFPPPL